MPPRLPTVGPQLNMFDLLNWNSNQQNMQDIPLTDEQRREAGVLQAMDQRASQGIARDLARAEQVSGARALGFDSPRALQDYLFGQKLAMETYPARIKGEYDVLAAQAQAEAAMARDRARNADIVARQQATQENINQRMYGNQMRSDALRRAAAMESGKAPLPSRGWGQALGDLLSGRFEGQRRREEAERIRQTAPPMQQMPPMNPNVALDPEMDPDLEGGWTTLPNGMRYRQR